MKPEVVTAMIAAIVAVISATISIYGQIRVAQLSDRLAKQREAESRETQTAALMSIGRTLRWSQLPRGYLWELDIGSCIIER